MRIDMPGALRTQHIKNVSEENSVLEILFFFISLVIIIG